MYVDKINSLIDDINIYGISNSINIDKDIISFYELFKKTRQKLKKTWTSLIEHQPTVPTLYDLPKIYKPNTPLQFIFSNIGSTKIVPPLLDTISPLHVINSEDLLNKINNIDIQQKNN